MEMGVSSIRSIVPTPVAVAMTTGIPQHRLQVSEPTSPGVAADTAPVRYWADGQSHRDENEDSAPKSPSVLRTSIRKAQLTCSLAAELSCRCPCLERKRAIWLNYAGRH